MDLRKTKPPHLSMTNSRETDENGVEEVFQGKITDPVDHWDFLDEIEAPMWADLTSESKSTYQDNDNDWFRISHPFHQCSSHQLISAFSHSGEGCTNSIVGIQGPSSPKLPSSVSRSRGKQYKSREWGWRNCRVTLNKKHPVKNLSSKSSRVNSGSGKEIKPKSINEKSKGISGLKAGSVYEFETRSTETAEPNYSKTVSSFGDSKPHSNSTALIEDKSNSMSTITSEGSEKHHQKSLEVSSQIFGHSTRLLSTLRISLRKSCVTRQASRVEINGGRKSEGCKSSSSKSSVGSSSNPGCDGKNLTLRATQNKDNTPDSRNVMRISQALKNKGKSSIVSKAPAVQVRDISNSRWGNETINSKFINQETTKVKVQPRSLRAKVLVTRRVNEEVRLTSIKAKDKVGVSQHNRFAVCDKENALGIMDASQESNTREKAVRDLLQVQKASKWSVSQKSGKKKPCGPKGKINARNEEKKSTNVVQKVYLR